MSNLLKHIEDTNKSFINQIINAIKDDNDWLINLGISERELSKDVLIQDFIIKYVSNPENFKTIDLLLKYVITDFLEYDDHIPLIKHVVSADSYGSMSALYVFKCGDLYFCYFIGDEMETLITKNPDAFCREAAKSIIDYYEIEKESLKDEWFNNSDAFNKLIINFNFDNP
jgi:hypothetical protein